MALFTVCDDSGVVHDIQAETARQAAHVFVTEGDDYLDGETVTVEVTPADGPVERFEVVA
jgi:hypothetical protein